MRPDIQERCLKTAPEIRENTAARIETFPKLLEISKKSVHRHKISLAHR